MAETTGTPPTEQPQETSTSAPGAPTPSAAPSQQQQQQSGFSLDGIELCVGTWAWGDHGQGLFTKWAKSPTPNEFDDNRGAFDVFVEKGIRFFDSAEIYCEGESERVLGRLQKESSVPVAIATKFVPLPTTLFQSSLRSHLVESLKRLQRPHVELYQVHGLAYSMRSAEVWAEGLAEVQKEGLAKAVGVSNFNSDQVRRAHAVLAKHGIPLASNQIEYSLLHRLPETSGLIANCKALGVRILAYSPLAMGRLTGKYTTQKQLDDAKHLQFGKTNIETLLPLVEKLKAIGAAHGGKTASMVAINWVICKGAIPICGAKTAQQATENAGATGWRMTEAEVAELDALSQVGTSDFWQGNTK